MFRRLTAVAVLAFSFAAVSFSDMATGQDKKETTKTKSTTKNTAKSSKKGKGTGDVPSKTEKTDK